ADSDSSVAVGDVANSTQQQPPPPVPAAAKQILRDQLLRAIALPESRLRSTAALTVALAAQNDWPDDWPGLFDSLIELLSRREGPSVHGALRVLQELVREMSEQQAGQLAPVIMPHLLAVLASPDQFPAGVRARAAVTMATLLAFIGQCGRPALAAQCVQPFLEDLIPSAVGQLESPACGHRLRKELLGLLTSLVTYFPGHLAPYKTHLLPAVWRTLVQSAQAYLRQAVDSDSLEDEAADSEGGEFSIQTVCYGLFDFVEAMLASSKFRADLKTSLDDLLVYLVLLMQIRQCDTLDWQENPDKFVAEEEIESTAYSVRASAQSLLDALRSDLAKSTSVALVRACGRLREDLAKARSAGDANWWRRCEALLLAMGASRKLLTKSGGGGFDSAAFVEQLLIPTLQEADYPFLQGRALWCAGRFALYTPPQHLPGLLAATAAALSDQRPVSVRVCAARAVMCYCDHLKAVGQESLLKPHLAQMFHGLSSLAFTQGHEVKCLCMESLCFALPIDPRITAGFEGQLGPLALAMLLKFYSDPVLVDLCLDVFTQLAGNPACRDALRERLLPPMCSILQTYVRQKEEPTADAASDSSAGAAKPDVGPLTAIAIDVLKVLIRGCGDGGCPAELVSSALPLVCQVARCSDDSAVLQNTGECLRALVSVASDLVRQYRDPHSQATGLDLLVACLLKLLDNQAPEAASSEVGMLVCVIFSRLSGDLAPALDLILRACLSKLLATETLTVAQSVILVFSQLCLHHPDHFVSFLSVTPDSRGRPALEQLLKCWLSRQHLFFGAYQLRVTVMALTALLDYCIKTDNPALQTVMLDGDPVDTGQRSTRRAGKQEFKQIPAVLMLASSRCADDGVNDDFCEGLDDEDDDPDVAADPVNRVDLRQHLADFLTRLAQQPFYASFAQHHNPMEKKALRTCLGIQLD
uniref:Importin N-terminal domain-containing protein n=1 Tax=Macrostomum lignano TaxID=282301 RepID=A0A1I8IPT5_9PLAT